MMGYDIETVLKRSDWRVRSAFRGVYSIDNLPKNLPIGQAHALVCNLSPVAHPGTHWVAIHISAFGDVTYFDSFGKPPTIPEINLFINYHARTVTYNKIPVQGSMSRTCGLYCVHFIIKRCEGFSLSSILSSFHPFKPKYNDRFVLNKYGV